MLFDRKKIYEGRVIQVSVDTVDLPNGVRLPLEIVRHPGGAAAVAIDADNRVCLLRQYRHAAGGYIYELPAGKLEPDEPPEITARRELAEEAARRAQPMGIARRLFQLAGRVHRSDPPVPGDRTSRRQRPHRKPTRFSRSSGGHSTMAVGRARNGELTDAKTIIGILRAASRRKIA